MATLAGYHPKWERWSEALLCHQWNLTNNPPLLANGAAEGVSYYNRRHPFLAPQIAYGHNGKDTPNIQMVITLFLYQIQTQFLRVWWGFRGRQSFSGSAISNMLSKFSREPRELPQQPNLGKISKKCTDFSSARKIENFFTRIVRFLGSANLNMLSEILREPREFPWQPNFDKNSQNCTKFPA